MVDKLKEFTAQYDQTLTAGAVSVPVGSAPANTQHVVKEIWVKMSSPDLIKRATLSHKGSVQQSFEAPSGADLDVQLTEGSQLVEANDDLTLELSASRVYKPAKLLCLTNNASEDYFVDFSVAGSEQPLTKADVDSSIVRSQFGNSAYASSDSIRVTLSDGREYIVFPNGGGGNQLYAYDIEADYADGQAPFNLGQTLPFTAYGLATDGQKIWAISNASASALIHEYDIASQTWSELTTVGNVPGRPGNQGGWFEYYNGYLYSGRYNSTLQHKVNISTGQVTTFGASTSQGHIFGSCIVTTTHDTRKTFLLIFGSANIRWVNLDTQQTGTLSHNGTSSTFYGNVGVEVLPGVGWAKAPLNGYELWVDCNGDTPVRTIETTTAKWIWNESISGDYAVVVALDDSFKAPPPAVYSAYAAGIEIKEAV